MKTVRLNTEEKQVQEKPVPMSKDKELYLRIRREFIAEHNERVRLRNQTK